MPGEVWPIVAAHWSRPAFYAGMRSHVEAIPDTVREMQDAEPIRSIPVLVLTPGKSTPLTAAHLYRIGDNARQIIAEESAHWIHLDEPALVIDSIREMVVAATRQEVPVTV
jgi:pimeloyl-ACP methyl ester carboxylesterase